jgi:glutamate 5-kinase
MKKTIGIKISSNIITDGNGKVHDEFILEICRQSAQLLRQGFNVFIVTSGAVASDWHKKRSKNLRSAVGQPIIMHRYSEFFSKYGVEAAQMLFVDKHLLGKEKIIPKILLQEAFKEKVIPIINANDAVDDAELKALEYCADNDRLFNAVCDLISVDIVVIGFSEKGLLDNNGNVVYEVRENDREKIISYAKGGSKLGHGTDGMKTKLSVLCELAKKGMQVTLAPGKERDFILRAVAGEKNFGTKFVN